MLETPQGWDGELRRTMMPVFVAEAEEHIEVARRCLVALTGTDQAHARLLLDDLVREARSLKVASGAMELDAVRMLSDGLEALFDRVRSDGRFADDILDLAGAVLGMLTAMIRGCVPETDHEGGLIELEHATAGLETVGRPS